MKKQLLILLLVALSITACKKDRTPQISPVDLSVKVSYDIATSGYTLPINEVTIKITNINTGASQELKTGGTGTALFKSISAGTYDIDANYEVSAANYTQITGIQTEENVIFNASEKSKLITPDFNGDVELKLITGKTGDWVIKQVYYTGSDLTDGATFRDQFLEFHNNTDRILYADSLYFGQLWGRQNTTDSKYNTLPNGQLDWNKSVNMPTNINANANYVYMRSLFMIPGTGKQYPVQPGKSIVVAQTALNHKSPFTGTDGKVISVRNPSLTIDLSKADFETYYGDIFIAEGGKPFASDVDNPNVPNVEIISYYGKDMVLDNLGRDSYVIFKVDGTQKVKQWPQYNEPTKAAPTSTATKYLQVPVKYVIDGVDVQPNTPADRIAKKLTPGVDAGFTFAPKGKYTSQSIIRKTQKTVNGRIVLKDTNNSTEDFDFLDLANPWGFK
jgi:hypothetical protein